LPTPDASQTLGQRRESTAAYVGQDVSGLGERLEASRSPRPRVSDESGLPFGTQCVDIPTVWSRFRVSLSLLCAVSILSAPMESLVAELHDGDGDTRVVHVSEPSDSGHKTPGDAPVSHDVHLCHCAHSHLSGVPHRGAGRLVPAAIVRVSATDEVPPPPAAREALLRPPILIS
jgi:hypothetical protein